MCGAFCCLEIFVHEQFFVDIALSGYGLRQYQTFPEITILAYARWKVKYSRQLKPITCAYTRQQRLLDNCTYVCTYLKIDGGLLAIIVK